MTKSAKSAENHLKDGLDRRAELEKAGERPAGGPGRPEKLGADQDRGGDDGDEAGPVDALALWLVVSGIGAVRLRLSYASIPSMPALLRLRRMTKGPRHCTPRMIETPAFGHAAVAAPHRLACRNRPADPGPGRQCDRGDGRHGGDDRRRLSAYELDRRRWLLADRRRRKAGPLPSMPAGAAGARATIRHYRELGHDTIPTRGALAALTVPGAISGWELALDAAQALRRPAAARPCCSRTRSATPATASPSRRRRHGSEPRDFDDAGRVARLCGAVHDRRQAAGARRNDAPAGPGGRRSSSSPMPASTISTKATSPARSPPISSAIGSPRHARGPSPPRGEAARAAGDADRRRHALQLAAADARASPRSSRSACSSASASGGPRLSSTFTGSSRRSSGRRAARPRRR